jgi:hypothetical protein
VAEQTYPFTEEGLTSALTALGTTPHAVATNLSAMGFRGCRDQESNCPVAHYLLASLPDMASVSVFSEAFNDATNRTESGHVEGYDLDLDRPTIVVNLPAAVVAFVDVFDKGGYSDLDMEASNA